MPFNLRELAVRLTDDENGLAWVAVVGCGPASGQCDDTQIRFRTAPVNFREGLRNREDVQTLQVALRELIDELDSFDPGGDNPDGGGAPTE